MKNVFLIMLAAVAMASCNTATEPQVEPTVTPVDTVATVSDTVVVETPESTTAE